MRWLWFLDAIARTLEAFELADGRYAVLGSWSDDARPRIPPFDAIELEPSALWEDVELGQPE